MEAAKMPSKKISSCAVDTDVVVLFIPVVQQLWVDKLWGWQKSPAIADLKSNYLAFFRSLTGCNKRSFILGHGKRWVSFKTVTGYFVKMNSLPKKKHLQITSAPLNVSSQYCMVEQASNYMNIDMAR